MSGVGEPRGDRIRYADSQVLGVARLQQDVEGQDREVRGRGAGQGEPGGQPDCQKQDDSGTPQYRPVGAVRSIGCVREPDVIGGRNAVGWVRTLDRLDVPDEPVTLPRERFNEFRRVGGIAQRLARFLDRRIQAVLEIDERLRFP